MEYPGHHSLCPCCTETTKLQVVLLKGTLKRKLTKIAPQGKQKLSKTCLTNYNRKFSQQLPLCKRNQKIDVSLLKKKKKKKQSNKSRALLGLKKNYLSLECNYIHHKEPLC